MIATACRLCGSMLEYNPDTDITTCPHCDHCSESPRTCDLCRSVDRAKVPKFKD